MDVEIAICTWNRSAMLARTLGRLSQLEVGHGVALRLIVVNNNSTDSTDDVIKQHSQRIEICSLVEKRQGHALARNKAVKVAEGDLLLWIDDDVLVGDQWLAEYVQACREQPDACFWGGPIRARFDHQQPKWIDDNWDKLSGCFAVRELGKQEFNFSMEQLPYGANFAIRTSVQKQFPFSTELGRTDSSVLGEDELNLFRKLLLENRIGRWRPHAAVDHIIDASRTTTAFIGRYFVGQGQALVSKGEQWSSDVRQLEREARHELFWFKVKRHISKSDVWLSHLIRGSLARGQAQALDKRGQKAGWQSG